MFFVCFPFQHIVVEPPTEVQDECSRHGKQVKHPKAIGTYFRDGRRKIDYVLVHEEVGLALSRSRGHNTTIQSSLPLPFRPEEKSLHGGMRPTLLTSTIHQNTPKQNRKIDIRKTFIDKLKSQGIEVEEVCFSFYFTVFHFERKLFFRIAYTCTSVLVVNMDGSGL